MDGAPFAFMHSARVECSRCHVQAECGTFSVAYGQPSPRPTLPRGWSTYSHKDFGTPRILCSLHRAETRVVDNCACGDPRCPPEKRFSHAMNGPPEPERCGCGRPLENGRCAWAVPHPATNK
jgi:hypothetical protein